ncbi:hypothetical protein PG994_003858 [Apiospora phragmitis]|uniref:Major facilitator superfamily (MFS) profile domain-containing protein n=1 Tax=Apiospora phragmitis TaxID=2905665 RepID=A0ABR1VZA7_9PEZI
MATAKAHSRVQAAAERALADQTNLQLSRARLLTVFAVLAATLLVSFVDQNGIGVTLPTVAADLGAGATVSWAGTASLVANTAFAMLYGRLSDLFGRKAVFLVAVGLLSVAALLCGFAQNAAMCIYVFRALAGIGGGGVSNLAMIIVSDIVTLERRGKYQGLIGSCVGLGNILGPFLAAAFISRATWRAFFWTTAPLAALMGGVGWFLIPGVPPSSSSSQPPQRRGGGGVREGVGRIDWAGVLTSSVAVVFLLIPISGGGAYFSWRSPMVISMLVVGVLSLGLFIFVEWRVARLPMMPLDIFKNPVIAVMLTQSFLFGAVYQSYLYYLPLYLQNARRYSVMESAAFTAALVAVQAIFSIAAGQYITRTKRYGEVIWRLLPNPPLHRHHPRRPHRPPPPLHRRRRRLHLPADARSLPAHVTKAKRAVIIANRNFFRCGGGACGLAVSGAVLQAALRASLPREFAYLADDTYTRPSSDVIFSEGEEEAVLGAYVAASRAVFILQIPLIGLCLLGCAFIRDRGLEPLKDNNNGDDDGEVKEAFNASVDELRQQQQRQRQPEEKTGPGNPIDESIRGDEVLVQVENRYQSKH